VNSKFSGNPLRSTSVGNHCPTFLQPSVFDPVKKLILRLFWFLFLSLTKLVEIKIARFEIGVNPTKLFLHKIDIFSVFLLLSLNVLYYVHYFLLLQTLKLINKNRKIKKIKDW
jgi:hypothetical protein